jgi:ABC-type transport system involved in multi-copper enzyme maturation permease subunit
MRLLVSGVRKNARRLATWLTFGLLTVLLALILIVVGASGGGAVGSGAQPSTLTLVTFPGAYDSILSFILGLGGLLAVIYGAAIAGSEWTWGTLKNAIARGESRSRYILVSFASVAIVIAVGVLIAFVVGVVAALLGATLAHVSTSGLTDGATLARLPATFVKGWFAIIEEGALGFAIATVARSQLAGIGVGIALYFGEAFGAFFLPNIIKYLPFNVATAVVASDSTTGGGGFGGGGAPTAILDPNSALVLVTVWLIGSLVVAALFTERAEITA